MASTIERVSGKTIGDVQTSIAEVIGDYLHGEKMGEGSERVFAVRLDKVKSGKGWSGVVDVLSGSDPPGARGPINHEG